MRKKAWITTCVPKSKMGQIQRLCGSNQSIDMRRRVNFLVGLEVAGASLKWPDKARGGVPGLKTNQQHHLGAKRVSSARLF